MTQQGVRWTADQVLALAPDAASRKAGSRLGAAGPWSGTGAGEGAVWGLCKGSGGAPYRTAVAVCDRGGGPGYTCSCPSRKFPCKHALGLLLLWAAGEVAPAGSGPSTDPGTAPGADDLVDGSGTDPSGRSDDGSGSEPPDWTRRWLTGRRQQAERGAGDAEPTGPKDAEAARRRAERRAERMAAGASELEQRLLDLLRGGLADAGRAGYGAWEETAARMVDAQAPGLGSRVRELGAVAASGPGWPGRLLAECALLHLLVRAFLGLSALPEPLATTVRSRVGVSVRAAELLAAEGAAVRDRWLVLGSSDSVDDRLTTRRVWLRGEGTGRMALLLDFGAAGRAPELSLPTGLSVEAEMAHYPGVRPLRAALGERFAQPTAGGVPPGTGVGPALATYGEALRDDPWLDGWPVVLSGVVPIPGEAGPEALEAGHGWQLADAEGDAVLPVDRRAQGNPGLWRLMSISCGGPVTVFGECGHRGFTPLTAWSPETQEAVPL
ncbi:MAG TPA: hypothetical protein DEQ61_17235 [Streptomyces sp.]|nr:hypothetical protein [Streptomyces sp.]